MVLVIDRRAAEVVELVALVVKVHVAYAVNGVIHGGGIVLVAEGAFQKGLGSPGGVGNEGLRPGHYLPVSGLALLCQPIGYQFQRSRGGRAIGGGINTPNNSEAVIARTQ